MACYPDLSDAVSAKLRRKWSPKQIAGWLKRSFPKELHKQVSHETIYKSLYIQARGVLKKELLEHLRAKRTVRSDLRALNGRGLARLKI
jgi:IS30 family transposase